MAEVRSENQALHQDVDAWMPDGHAALEMGLDQYHSLRNAIFEAGQPLVTPRCRIVDLHCGQGDHLEPFIQKNEDLCRFIMVDPSASNVRTCMDRFHMRMHLGFVQPSTLDLSKDFPDLSSRLTICVGGLGPLPRERRSEVLSDVRRHLEKGGGFIMVEELQNEDDCASWMMSLREAGFDHIERIWSAGNVCAWIARK